MTVTVVGITGGGSYISTPLTEELIISQNQAQGIFFIHRPCIGNTVSLESINFFGFSEFFGGRPGKDLFLNKHAAKGLLLGVAA
jgi:hypothetical protein